MKGRNLTHVKHDVKEWVLKRAKSGTSEGKLAADKLEKRAGLKSPENNYTQSDNSTVSSPETMHTENDSTFSPSVPAKITFSAKGAEFRVDPRYSFVKTLGVGAYGVVCSALDSCTGSNVAIKKVTGVFDDQTDAKRIIREIRLLSSMRHDNILRITDIDEPESYDAFNDVYLVTELMDTDLNKLLRSKHPLLEAQRKFFTYQLLRALKYIHSASILHRDLKPANVLISENCDLKICDFGLARYVDPTDGPGQAMTEYVVTRWYRAPELLLANDEYTTAIDMWSAGCLLAELYTRRPLFPGRDVKNQIEVICQLVGKPTKEQIKIVPNRRAREFIASLPDSSRTNLGQIMKEASPEAIDLVNRLLQFDPKDRLTASQALNHPYVAEFRDESSETVADPRISIHALEPPNEKTVGRDGIRRLMWDEILKFHPSARLRESQNAVEAEKRIQALNPGSMTSTC